MPARLGKFIFVLTAVLAAFSAGALSIKTETSPSDCTSAFAKKRKLVCKSGCGPGEICISVSISKDTKQSLSKKVRAQIEESLSSATGEECGKGIDAAASDLVTDFLARLGEMRRDPSFNRAVDDKITFPVDRASVENYPAIRSGCQSCGSVMRSRLDEARLHASTMHLLSQLDVDNNVEVFSDGVKPTSCRDNLRRELKLVFQARLRRLGVELAGMGDPSKLGSAEYCPPEEQGKGKEKGKEPGAGKSNFGNGNSEGKGALTCQYLKDILRPVPEAKGLCQTTHRDLYDFYQGAFKENMNKFFEDSHATGRFEHRYVCSEIAGEDNIPGREIDRTIVMSCDSCLRSNEIMDHLSAPLDEETGSYRQSLYDYGQAFWCRLGAATTTDNRKCAEYLRKYDEGALYENLARMIGPEVLPALEQGLSEFEAEVQSGDCYKKRLCSLANGAIRVPTTIAIPGLNRRICMAGALLDPGKSSELKDRPLTPEEVAREESAVLDRNFGQGAASALARVTMNTLYDSTSKEIDCITLPARLVRSALKTQGCAAMEALRGHIKTALKNQGKGQLLMDFTVGAAIAMVAPGGYLLTAISVCGQAAFDSALESRDQFKRQDNFALEREQITRTLAEAQELRRSIQDAQGAFSKEDLQRMQESAKGMLKSCAHSVYKMGLYIRLARYGKHVISKAGVDTGLTRAMANNPVLTEAIIHQVGRRELSPLELLNALPLDVRVRNAGPKTLLENMVEHLTVENGYPPGLRSKFKQLVEKAAQDHVDLSLKVQDLFAFPDLTPKGEKTKVNRYTVPGLRNKSAEDVAGKIIRFEKQFWKVDYVTDHIDGPRLILRNTDPHAGPDLKERVLEVSGAKLPDPSIRKYDQATDESRARIAELVKAKEPDEAAILEAENAMVKNMAESLRARGYVVTIQSVPEIPGATKLKILRGSAATRTHVLHKHLQSLKRSRYSDAMDIVDGGDSFFFDPTTNRKRNFDAHLSSSDRYYSQGRNWDFSQQENLTLRDAHEAFHSMVTRAISLAKNVKPLQAMRAISFQSRFNLPGGVGDYMTYRRADEVDARLTEAAAYLNSQKNGTRTLKISEDRDRALRALAEAKRFSDADVTNIDHALEAMGKGAGELRLDLTYPYSAQADFANLSALVTIPSSTKFGTYQVKIPGISVKRGPLETKAEFQRRVEKLIESPGDADLTAAKDFTLSQLTKLRENRELISRELAKFEASPENLLDALPAIRKSLSSFRKEQFPTDFYLKETKRE